MALYKPIKQDDGVITNYHRIMFCQLTTNAGVSIAVLSYIDKGAREEEENGTVTKPYVRSITYETDYDKNMTVKKAYEFLKTLPVFEGAEDILDDNDPDEISGEELMEMIEEVL